MKPETIRDITAWALGLTPYSICEQTTRHDIAHPRMVAVYLMRRYTGTTFRAIAALVGLSDHSTAVYAMRTVEQQMPFFRPLLERAQRALLAANDYAPLETVAP